MKNSMDMEKIYDEHAVRLYNMSLRILGDSCEAEEVTHDTLLQYYGMKDRSGVVDLRKWLSSVCIRKSIDRLRQKKKFMDLLEDYEDPVLEDPACDDLDLDVGNIRKALSLLPDNYRLILSLHLFEGYDYEEITQITGIKEVTVRSLYMRGRRKLAEILKQRQWTD
jgi:RNA polymerase sigma-70 factor (ECF subfamily)